MPTTLIEQKPNFTKKVEGERKLAIAELFCDTVQGEGINSGKPSTFLRLQGCTLNCVWCDTAEVWRFGNEYSFDEVFNLFESADLIQKFKLGKQHLILTGGSPLKQQVRLVCFLNEFFERYGFIPYIEVENETVLMPSDELSSFVSCWNNSPKLANSGMKRKVRYKPDVIAFTAGKHTSFTESWFKFVVTCEEDWQEIQADFIDTGLIDKNQIIVMPEGQVQSELALTREMAVDMAIKHEVRFCDRLHITVWNKKTGV